MSLEGYQILHNNLNISDSRFVIYCVERVICRAREISKFQILEN